MIESIGRIMKWLIIILIPLVVAASCGAYFLLRNPWPIQSTATAPSLVKVFIAFRHGSRSPVNTYASDERNIDNRVLWPEGAEQLTEKGKREAYQLGKRLRERYGNFVGAVFKPEEVRSFNTKRNRTIITGQLVMSALFPPPGYLLGEEELNWVDLPHYPDYVLNFTVTNGKCAFYDDECEGALIDLERGLSPDETKTLAIVMEHAGEPDSNPFQLFRRVWDVINFQAVAGLPLPDWAREIYPEKVFSIGLKILKAYIDASELQRKLVTYDYAIALRDFFLSEDDRKMELHSWHDINHQELLATLRIPLEKYPEPTACIAVELHRVETEKFIQVYSYDSYRTLYPEQLTMPCGKSCPAKVLEQLVDMFRVENITEVCGGKQKAEGDATHLKS